MSDAEWDADDFEPLAPGAKPAAAVVAVASDKWVGEDEEDEIKDNWDDEEEEKSEMVNGEGLKAAPVKKKKSLAERIAEKEAQKKAEAEERRKKEEEAARLMTPEQIAAEKLRQQKIIEDADLEIAADTFGVAKQALAGNVIDNYEPETKEEFEKFTELLRTKICQYDKSPHYVPFLDMLFRDLSVSLEVEDMKKLGSTLNALGNEKQKQAKASTKGKKKTKGKLNSGREDNYDDMMVSGYDEFDDFM